MSNNNASFYAREDSQPVPSSGENASYAAPSRQNQSSQEFDRVSNEINQPIDYAGLGMKARKIKEGMGPLQVPIGQTIHGAIKDTEENVTLGDVGKVLGPAAVMYGLKKLWDNYNKPPDDNNPPNNPPNNTSRNGPIAPTEPSPLEQERLKQAQYKTQREELRLKAEQDRIARANAQYEANQAAAQAKRDAAAQQKSAVPPLPEKDAEMLGNSMRAAQQKAIDADIKAQQAKQAAAQTTTAEAATSPVIEQAAQTKQPIVPTQQAPAAAPAPIEELRTGTGKPAFAGQAEPTGRFKSSYKDVSEVPKGYAFVPEAQYVDTSRNALTQPTFTDVYSKRPYPTTYEQATKEAADINRSLGRLTREEALAQGIPKEKIGEPTPGIAKKVNNKALVKVGGVAGALIALPSLSQAAQERDFGKAADILTDFLVPMFGQSSVAGMPRQQEEAILADKFKEAQKLGSPYRSVPPPKR